MPWLAVPQKPLRMAVEYVLRISRSDSEGEYVLVNVTSPAGASALDLRLLATEGENPYVLSCKSLIIILHGYADRLLIKYSKAFSHSKIPGEGWPIG